MAFSKIETTAISDDAVTLAKMASGTDGNVITYDASGNPAVVATGTSGHFLKSQGAGSVPVFAAATQDTPYFMASLNVDQGVANTTDTKIQMNREILDSGSVYDPSTNYRFTPGVAGKYFFRARITPETACGSGADVYCTVWKNGAAAGINPLYRSFAAYESIVAYEGILDSNTTDYFELYMYQSTGGTFGLYESGSSALCYWMGWRIA